MNTEDARRLAIEYGLSGPSWALDPNKHISEILSQIKSSGGCGPGKIGDYLVPDTIWGLNIKPACYIHDCRYSIIEAINGTHETKRNMKYSADKELFDNIDKIIYLKSNWIMRLIRRRVALVYFDAVDFGGEAFVSS